MSEPEKTSAGEDDRGPPWVWHEDYRAEIGPHVFPTVKYRKARDRLVEEQVLREAGLERPEPVGREALERVHDEGYLRKIEERSFTRHDTLVLEVPLTDSFVRASRLCADGTTRAGRRALEEGVCLHLGGGFHHAFSDHGEGFCLLNDVAVAIRSLQAAGRLGRASVVDCDVHQGNGTAAIFADDPGVFTFSIHQERNYPFEKPPSDVDVGLPDGIGDDDYLARLTERLPEAVVGHRPELVFYLAGADPYRQDQLGGLALSRRGLRRRDEAVLEACREAGVSVAVCLAGGYAVRLEDTVEIHCGTGRAVAESWRRREGRDRREG